MQVREQQRISTMFRNWNGYGVPSTTFYLAQEHCIAWQDQGAAPWPLPRWLPRESFWFRIRLHTMMQSVSIVYSRPTLLCELLRSVVHGLQIVNSVATPSVVSRANEIRQGWQLWMINFSTSHNHAEITPFSTVFVTCNPCGFTNITYLGTRAGQVGEWSDQWKVLVYDKPCRNIISTLLHVTQLRKQGVTLHMLVRCRFHLFEQPAMSACSPSIPVNTLHRYYVVYVALPVACG